MKWIGGVIAITSMLMSPVIARASCASGDALKASILKMPEGTWKVMDHDQFRFLQGIYAMHPRTEAGLPEGDGAVLAHAGEEPMTEIIFTKGDDLVCIVVEIPNGLAEIVENLEGKGL